MATTARPLLVCLLLCLCCASCQCSHEEEERQLAGGGGGYRVRPVTVDKGGARLGARLAAVGGGSAAYGDDVQNLDVYAS
ncbi:hypothetical protein ACP4OV_013843 [Aristida adscensionis]